MAGVAALACFATAHSGAAATGADPNPLLHELQTRTSVSAQTGVTVERRSESWQDLSSGRSRSVSYDTNGHVDIESGNWTTGNIEHGEAVFYPAHAWTTSTHTFPTAPTHSGVQGYSDAILQRVQHGELTVTGSDTIGTSPALVLTESLPVPSFPANLPAAIKANFPTELELWVDPGTWLPIREEMLNSSQSVVSRTDYEWLPRTSANLVHLNLVVPAGFKQVDPSSGSGSAGPAPTGPGSGTTLA